MQFFSIHPTIHAQLLSHLLGPRQNAIKEIDIHLSGTQRACTTSRIGDRSLFNNCVYVCSANEQALSLLCASVGGGPSKTYEPLPPVQSRHEPKLHYLGLVGWKLVCFLELIGTLCTINCE